MAGGLLQLVAKGADDVFLTVEPQITFFKIVYRRHTNFSKVEYDINFSKALTFGSSSDLIISKTGDLLHKLFLVINLPKIDITYTQITVGQVKQLLRPFNITWTTTKPDNSSFTQSDYNEVVPLINSQINTLNNNIGVLEYLLQLLTSGSLNPTTWLTNNPSYTDITGAISYFTDILNAYYDLPYDPYSIQWKFFIAHRQDTLDSGPILVATANLLQNQILFTKFKNYVTGIENVSPPFDPTSYNDENLFFMYNVDYANYNVTSSSSQLTTSSVFRTAITNSYQPDVSYQELDAYKIFNTLLLDDPAINTAIISSINDVNRIKAYIITTIQFCLQKNITQLLQIYYSLTDDAKFMFYRLFPVKTGGFDTSQSFVNISLTNNLSVELQDKWTNKFNVTPLPDEPTNLYFPMSVFVKNTISTFHNANTQFFRSDFYNSYFNFVPTMWSRLDMGTNTPAYWQPYITAYPPTQQSYFNRMYFMNFIPLLTNNDIPLALNDILNVQIANANSAGELVIMSNLQTIQFFLLPLLASMQTIISNTITPILASPDDFPTILKISSFRTTQGPAGDIIITPIIRQGQAVLEAGTYYIIPQYVIVKFLQVLDDPALQSLSQYNSTSNPNFPPMKQLLTKIIGYFHVNPDTENTSGDIMLPFTTYQNNSYNTDVSYPINGTTSNPGLYCDAISSIWYNIFTEFKDNYDGIYNLKLLGLTYFKENFGLEIFDYLEYITTSILGYNLVDPINYFYESTTFQTKLPYNVPGDIGTYLSDKLVNLENQLEHYLLNYGLMGVKTIQIPNQQLYFGTFESILNYIINVIETTYDSSFNLVYYHVPHPGSSDPVQIIKNQVLASVPNSGALDILNMVSGIYDTMIDPSIIVNPFSNITQPNKYNLWIELHNPVMYDYDVELQKYVVLFGGLTTEKLYSDLTLIDVNYEGFNSEDDIYSYMLNIISTNALLFSININNIQGVTVTNTNSRAIILFNAQVKMSEEDISKLNNIIVVLTNSLKGGMPANFSWIQYIGHYLIKKIDFYIGDQLIDTQFGESMHIQYQLSKRRQKLRGYNMLIGNVPELYEYNTNVKEGYELIIPLWFYFCKNITSSVPLVALQHSSVKLNIELRDFDEVCMYDQFTQFNKSRKLKCHMIAEYIYVEEEERMRIASNRHEYIISKIQSNGELIINRDNLNTVLNLDENIKDLVKAKLFFKNCVREMFWVLQDMDNVISKNYHVYSFLEGDVEVNPSSQIKIVFAGRDRETYKDAIFYNYILPMKFHSASPDLGINNYPFAINPENWGQPSGCVNMGRMDDSGIDTILRASVLEAIKNGKNFRLVVYAVSHNILRAISGLGGLAFFEN